MSTPDCILGNTVKPNSKLSGALRLSFEYQGQERTLCKTPKVQSAVRSGQMTEAAALLTPWYLRTTIKVDGQPRERLFQCAVDNEAAKVAARKVLKGQCDQPDEFTQFVKEREAKRAITLDELALEWKALQMPDERGKSRDERARHNLEQPLRRGLEYLGDKPAVTIEAGDMLDFAAALKKKCIAKGQGKDGTRAADLSLSALSCLCSWAVVARKIKTNPFAVRPKFQDSDDVKHCSDAMPRSDEEWHSILRWFWSVEYKADNLTSKAEAHKDTLRARVIGAWLCWTGLVGLRPGEPAHLFRHPALTEPPSGEQKRAIPYGTIYPSHDAARRMKVFRTKNGQNPAVLLHPIAADFLTTWATWLDTHIRRTTFAGPWFPNPADPTQPLFTPADKGFYVLRLIRRACQELKIPECQSKGFGRAFFVRVQRSQDEDDAAIALMLGQSSNGALVRSVYGDPDDIKGDKLFDWKPTGMEPAWKLLAAECVANVIAI